MPETTSTITHCVSLHHLCPRAGYIPFGLLSTLHSSVFQHQTFNKMQRVQNAAAKFVLGLKRNESSMEALKTLHWLPIKFRIQFKIMLLVYKCLNGQAPSYLSELLELKSTTLRPGLWSTYDRTLLCIPFTKRKTFADRSFSLAGPKLWNCLPKTIRESPNTDSFKKHLKAHMFDLAF